MKWLKILSILTVNILATQVTQSQIYFKNTNPEVVHIAFAQYKSDVKPGYWVTRGWFTIGPGKTITAFEKICFSDSIGYWGITVMSGTAFEGDKPLLVKNSEKFTIKNADKKWVHKQQPSYEWRNFHLIPMKPGTTTGTIKL